MEAPNVLLLKTIERTLRYNRQNQSDLIFALGIVSRLTYRTKGNKLNIRFKTLSFIKTDRHACASRFRYSKVGTPKTESNYGRYFRNCTLQENSINQSIKQIFSVGYVVHSIRISDANMVRCP